MTGRRDLRKDLFLILFNLLLCSGLPTFIISDIRKSCVFPVELFQFSFLFYFLFGNYLEKIGTKIILNSYGNHLKLIHTIPITIIVTNWWCRIILHLNVELFIFYGWNLLKVSAFWSSIIIETVNHIIGDFDFIPHLKESETFSLCWLSAKKQSYKSMD